MYLAIDGIKLIREPQTLEFVPFEDGAGTSADRRPLVRPGSEYTALNATWGPDLSHTDVLQELDRRRANRGVHAISVRQKGGILHTFNAYMGKAKPTYLSQSNCGKGIVNSFSVPFMPVELPVFLLALRFPMRGILAVQNGWGKHLPPAAGEIVAIDGWIRDLGSGAGATTMRIYNETQAKSYFSVNGSFPMAPPNQQMQSHTLAADLTFEAGDVIRADVIAIPAGGLSKDANLNVWALVHHP